MAGKILVNDIKYDKPGIKFNENVKLKFKNYNLTYVSRGGEKLQFAIDTNFIDCKNSICIDVGCSTGGFTDCLIKNGAIKIFAIDVGYGQLSWKLRQNKRVIIIERTNIRYLKKELVINKADIITIDVSFISLKVVIPSILKFLKKNGIIIALIKPQFEVGKNNISKNGFVNSILHKKIIKELFIFFDKISLKYCCILQSPLLGLKSGNKEFLVLIKNIKS